MLGLEEKKAVYRPQSNLAAYTAKLERNSSSGSVVMGEEIMGGN